NDLNTPTALAIASEAAQAIQQRGVSRKQLSLFNMFLELFDQFFGLRLSDSADISDQQKALIKKRDAARADKNFAASDKLRDELSNQGIGLRDTASGAVWFRL
ncbi:MAG TPA: hypothetical protein VNG90_04690, partial [Candidatus Acidoferrum sp.]|nr:hypothetical protein [Candidatus Acidoferrum sp.]